ncbi:ABC transporter substrate-binding protein [Cohnella hongkongensis]|uniref:ABC transporter substrate-binding protein n=1 Tax=Cohnella hongkongensis TaxID=178337 RepID=A0ABV9FF63_9BACL
MQYGKKIAAALSGALIAGLAAGCSAGGNDETNNEITSMKVMYYDERAFYQQYGMLFSTLYPEVEIEVIETSRVVYEEGKDMEKAMQDFVEEQKPDVLMLGASEYARMASEGKLYNLDTFIQKDKFDLEGIAPGILEYIKQQSDGILYGLAPEFHSQALFYNKDLFSKHGVTPPTDGMSWEEVLQLAARFPTDGSGEDRIYGLRAGYVTDLYQLGMMLGNRQGLSYINPTTQQLTINSDSWKKAFETADTALKSGSLYVEDRSGGFSGSYEDYLLQEPFIGQKVAMAIESNYMLDQIKEAKTRLKDKGVQNWDIVTVPINPANPNESTAMSVGQIFAISAQTANADAAWKFVQYINGDDFARVTSKLRNGSFPSRTKYIESEEGINMAAFYSMKPMARDMYRDYDKLPRDFLMKFDGLTQQEFQGVKDGSLTIAEALDNLQAKGQQLLADELEKEATAEPGSGSDSGSSGAGEMIVTEVGESSAVPAE